MSGQTRARVHRPVGAPATFSCLNKIEAEDWKVLLADVRSSNPAAADKLVNDPALRQRQVDSMRQLLAFSCQAVKDGIAAEPRNARELKNIRRETIATNYDKLKYPAGDHEMFSAITDAQIKTYFLNRVAAAAFDQFVADKLSLLKDADPANAGRVITPDEKQQAREFFAKVSISEAAYAREQATLGLPAKRKLELQAALQQAQFLARLYSQKIADKVSVEEDEVESYITQHPELDSATRTKALDILRRAKSGESFSALADSFTDDPGNTTPDGKKQGGLYSDVPKGRMIKVFEDSALSLRPGQVYPDIVKSEFGFHIIKLEKVNGNGADLRYDVRHILISTMTKDPDNPTGGEAPLDEVVRKKLANDKENAVLAKVLLANPIVLAPLPPPALPKAATVDH